MIMVVNLMSVPRFWCYCGTTEDSVIPLRVVNRGILQMWQYKLVFRCKVIVKFCFDVKDIYRLEARKEIFAIKNLKRA